MITQKYSWKYLVKASHLINKENEAQRSYIILPRTPRLFKTEGLELWYSRVSWLLFHYTTITQENKIVLDFLKFRDVNFFFFIHFKRIWIQLVYFLADKHSLMLCPLTHLFCLLDFSQRSFKKKIIF